MDPVSQGVLGGAAAQAVFSRRVPHAGWIGLLAGMAADLDIFIRSSSDPLLAIELHRHFTHALAFIPIGGLVCALPWLLLPENRRLWRFTVGASLLGYATHGLLDACTSYGTLLLWPFSSVRVGWDLISIVDLVFTVPLIIGMLVAGHRKQPGPARLALAFAGLYLAFGFLQHERALRAQEVLAQGRGHAIESSEVFPTLANNIVWRSLYRHEGRLYSDRIRVGWFSPPSVTEGSSSELVTLDGLSAEERADPRVVRDFQRFSWFSEGWVARAPNEPAVYGDARYSLRSDGYDPIWGVRFHPGRELPTEWVSRTSERDLSFGSLWREISGQDTGEPVAPDT